MYEGFHGNKDMFDFSKYPDNAKFYDGANKNEIGRMKDKTKGVPIFEFCGIKCTHL